MLHRRLLAVALCALALVASPAYAQRGTTVVSVSGSIDQAQEAVTLPLNGASNAMIQITGTFTGTLTFETTAIAESSTWVSVSVTPVASTTTVTTATSTGAWTVAVPGSLIRARASAWTSGTAVVTIVATTSGGGGGAGGGGGGTVTQGAAAASDPWLVKPHDGAAALFSAAAALADNTANPTVGGIAAYLMCWDGATWDRCLTGATADTEDGTIAGGQSNVALTVSQRYEWDGTDYNRPAVHDEADTAGAPYKLGARAETSLAGITLTADGDLTHLYAGIDGVLITRSHTNLEGIVTGNASNTDGTSTELVAAGAASVKHYLTTVTCTNAHATTFAYVEIKDGATAKHTIPLPAAAGATITFPVPLPGTAATAWNFDPSAAVTTIYCSAVGFKSKV
jgi:hypothetical protein